MERKSDDEKTVKRRQSNDTKITQLNLKVILCIIFFIISANIVP